MPKRLPDIPLAILIISLFTVGLIALYTAGGEARFWSQLSRGAAGCILMFTIAMLPLRRIRELAPFFFAAILISLVWVLFFGVKINNARRWLNAGFLLQPSELMKIALPMFIAYCYSRVQEISWTHHMMMLTVVVVPVLLVVSQPDLGTAVMVATAGILTVFFGGIGWAWIGGFGALGAAAVSVTAIWPSLLDLVLKPYQKKRILTLLDPEQDPLGAGYHTIQSEIAIGSGGVWGKGFQEGTQAQLEFLPERHTDFIFAVYAEEFGFAGACLMLSLVALITWRCLQIAGRSGDIFSFLAVAGIAAIFFMTFAVNLSMVSGLLPVVGMPLPLISYGGSALLAAFVGFGVILSASRRT